MKDKQLIAYILMGLPGSGKTTLRELIHRKYNYEIVTISSDDYLEWFAKICNTTYNQIFSDHIKNASKYMEEMLRVAIELQENIIWDQTNLTVKKRKQILNKIPGNYRKVCYYVNTPVDICIKNNNDRDSGRRIPTHIIENMASTIDEPTLEEGFDSIVKSYN